MNSNKTQISALIIADSKNPQGDRLTTMVITFPRFILAELNTHRLFSRNSASSRAIPFEKMLKSVQKNPFIPIAWQKDHKGMQGTDYFTETDTLPTTFHAKDNAIAALKRNWLRARDNAVLEATNLNSKGLTKQLCNRLLEPFMWHTVILSFTEIENFFDLRLPSYEYGGMCFKSQKDCYNNFLINHPEDLPYLPNTNLDWLSINKGQSEIHMMALSEAMYDAYQESVPKQLSGGEWHIPMGDKINDNLAEQTYGITLRTDKGIPYAKQMPFEWYNENINQKIQEVKIKIATAMCARISYTTVGEEDKQPNYENDIKLHDRLLESGHFSPFEHCARVMDYKEYETFIKGKIDFIDFEDDFEIDEPLHEYKGWCNNFKGFIQYRYLLENK